MRILIVEDHADSAYVMRRVLGNLGHEISVAESCASAIAAIERSKPDIALCDLGLPDGDGLQLMNVLRDVYQVRSAAVTGHGEERYRQQCMSGGFELLLKPIKLEQLYSVIERIQPALTLV